MNCLNKLQKVENSWLDPLYYTCQRVFKQVHLPSHNEEHHLRVWITTKELIKQLNKQEVTFTQSDLTKLIIAAFLHDTGMSVKINKAHGKESRKICEEFIKKYVSASIKNLQELYDVIEKHDDKEYKNEFTKNKNPKSLFKILSVCDDLDAFGLNGAYRYTEIYLLRGVNVENIAIQVLKNLTNRVNYFTESFGHIEKFYRKHLKRSDITRSFFTDLNNDLLNKNKIDSLSGPTGVINLINRHIINEERTPLEASKLIVRNRSDSYVKNYFRKLVLELTR